MRRFLVYVAAFALMGSTAAPAAAAATPRAELSVSRESGIVWFEAKVSSGESRSVRIKVFAPRKDGTRKLWQTCRFTFSGAGTYRCGMDAAPALKATRHEGRWRTRVYLDSARKAVADFRLRPESDQK